MSTSLHRRRFLSLSAALGARALFGASFVAPWRASGSLGVAFLSPASPDEYATAARLGARFGAEEGTHTAALFGRRLVFDEHAYGDAGDAARAARAALERGATVLVGGFDAESCLAVAEVAAAAGAAFLNVASADDRLRGDRCAASMFHVAASDAMRADALAAARAADAGLHPAATVELWHPTLERFGAAQLGDRFRARHGAGMRSAAWAGWFALKAVTDVALRAAPGASMTSLLASPSAQFDGHKGVRLSFRAWDRQLRQPLYVVHDERVVAELPPSRGAAATASVRERLDALGTPAGRSPCSLSSSTDS